MYRLRIDTLRDIAAAAGDRTAYAIHRRTGIAESAAYRMMSGESQPDLISMLRIHYAYGVAIESLMEPAELVKAAA
jgi:DNA-binding phage protein